MNKKFWESREVIQWKYYIIKISQTSTQLQKTLSALFKGYRYHYLEN